MAAAERVFSYLKGTPLNGLVYTKAKDPRQLTMYGTIDALSI
jgi:hypothetical protein